MSLADLIKKRVFVEVATATPATPATDTPEILPSVATVATVAVAKLAGRVFRPTLSGGQIQLADEAERRADFCERHRLLIGGDCERFNVIERLTPGDQAAALDACLLWRLIRTGQEIERAGAAEILPGTTVADVLAWVRHPQDDATCKERRLLLTAAESICGDATPKGQHHARSSFSRY